MNKIELFEQLYENLEKEFEQDFVNDIKLLINTKKFNKSNYLKIIGENFDE